MANRESRTHQLKVEEKGTGYSCYFFFLGSLHRPSGQCLTLTKIQNYTTFPEIITTVSIYFFKVACKLAVTLTCLVWKKCELLRTKPF